VTGRVDAALPEGIVVEPVRGIPMRVFENRPRSLMRLADIVRARPERELLVCGERALTDHELFDRAALVAGGLTARGLRRGDRVAMLAANSLEWAIAFWGTVAAGGIVAALNGWWTDDEVRYALGHCAPRFLVADREHLDRVDLSGSSVETVFEIDRASAGSSSTESFDALLDGQPLEAAPAIDEDDPVAIFYTSGTTGRPKGAIATHRSWIAAAQSLQFLAARTAASAPAAPPAVERGPDVVLATLPLFHVSGCQSTLVTSVVSGTRTVMLGGRFDPAEVLALIERERVTRWSGVPTMVSRVCRHPERDRFDLTSMRSISYGGSPAPPELPALVRETFPNVTSLGNAYGLTESGTIIAVNTGPDFEQRPRSAGRPFPVIEVRIGDGLPAGEVDEIHLRGPMVMPGYWDDPEATAAILSEDGWLHTGDLGFVDDEGFLYVTDRAKDVIIRGGENVYPAEIEQRLTEHPAVLEAAVIGIPHPDLGEAVQAFVRLADDAADVTDEELQRFVAERLARFKVPAVIERVDAPLPRNATGKLLKPLLRDRRSHD
jgi:long-chain acyl-CoA synthetase